MSFQSHVCRLGVALSCRYTSISGARAVRRECTVRGVMETQARSFSYVRIWAHRAESALTCAFLLDLKQLPPDTGAPVRRDHLHPLDLTCPLTDGPQCGDSYGPRAGRRHQDVAVALDGVGDRLAQLGRGLARMRVPRVDLVPQRAHEHDHRRVIRWDRPQLESHRVKLT